MLEMGTNDQRVRIYVTPKPSSSDLLFASATQDNQVQLSLNQVRLSSVSDFSGSTSDQANFNIFHC